MSGAAALHDGSCRLDPVSVVAARQPVAPVRIGGDLVWMRPARWSDGPAWCATRRREADHLRDAFGPGGETVSLVDWVEHLSAQRRALAAGLLTPLLVLHVDGRVAGEVNAHLDPSTGSVEASVWMASDTPSEVSAWAVTAALLRVFTLPTPITRIVAPIAVTNDAPRRLLALLGFTAVARARQYRRYGGQLVDHDIWWLDRTPEHVAHLAQVLATRVV